MKANPKITEITDDEETKPLLDSFTESDNQLQTSIFDVPEELGAIDTEEPPKDDDFTTEVTAITLLADKSLQKSTVKIKMPIVCLTMIVKNESKIMKRCLESTKDFVDCVCITDTGSDDNTIETIENWCTTHKMPYKVFTDTFKGFGVSRTQSFNNAKASFPEADYSFLLDADMVLEMPNFDKASLTLPAYRISQTNSGLLYPNTRLISTGDPWKLVCRTHEFWESPALARQGTIPYEQLRIKDLNDGGCKAGKFKRDLKLLKQDIHEEIHVPRNTFYLAQTYKDLGKTHQAIKRYKKRINLGAWTDEIWYSHYMIGTCYFRISQAAIDESDDNEPDIAAEADALRHLLKAFNDKPNRAEPLMELATYYRKRGMNVLTYHFAKLALTCDPKGELLFVEQSKYTWEPQFEICITGYYLGKKVEGLAACELLLTEFKDQMPAHIKAQVNLNKKFYQK